MHCDHICMWKLCSFRCTKMCGALQSANPIWLTGFVGQFGGCTSAPLRMSSGWGTETVSPACSYQVQFHIILPCKLNAQRSETVLAACGHVCFNDG